MADFDKLKAEVIGDPLPRGYSSMDDQAVVDSIYAVDRDLDRTSMSGDEVFKLTNKAEFAALDTDAEINRHKQSLWLSFTARADIDPFSPANEDFVKFIFGTGPTVTALVVARTIENGQSRRNELSIGPFNTDDVATVRI